MSRTRRGARAVLLAGVVVLSVVGASFVTTHPAVASDQVNDVTITSEQPAAGNGSITVRTALSPGAETVSFKVRDANGTTSEAVTVADNGSADLADADGVVTAELDLQSMFPATPATGRALVAVDQGADNFSFEYQTYDTKRQLTIDAAAPDARVLGDASGTDQQVITTTTEQQIKIAYTLTDDPQKVASARLSLVGPGGTDVKTFEGVQVGTDRAVQFTVPPYWDAGTYDIRLVAVDEAGHRTTTTFQAGLVIEPSTVDVSSQNVRVMEERPVAGSENVTLSIGTAFPGETAAIKFQDARGNVSERVEVTDGGASDSASMDGVIVTTVDLGALYGAGEPASGTALVGVDHTADNFSFVHQTYDVKRQFTLDADAPTVSVTGASTEERRQVTAAQGTSAKIHYSVTDDPEKVSSARMTITAPDDTTVATLDVQAGEDRAVQVDIPSDWTTGNYTIDVTAVDEVGHRTTTTYEGGLNVTSS